VIERFIIHLTQT